MHKKNCLQDEAAKELNIEYEDAHFIVVKKPPKVPSQSDPTGDIDMLTLVHGHLKKENPAAQNPYVGLVHRLDRPVGGIMAFAKTKKANANLSAQIQEKTFNKTYIAVVCGSPNSDAGELRDFLVKNAQKNMSRVVKEKRGAAKEAVLEYEVLERIESDEHGSLSLLRVNLMTGRHHQIRVQLSHAGFPIWGDTKYNSSFARRAGWTQIALWAHAIELTHPKTGKRVGFKSIPSGIFPFSLFEKIENGQMQI